MCRVNVFSFSICMNVEVGNAVQFSRDTVTIFFTRGRPTRHDFPFACPSIDSHLQTPSVHPFQLRVCSGHYVGSTSSNFACNDCPRSGLLGSTSYITFHLTNKGRRYSSTNRSVSWLFQLHVVPRRIWSGWIPSLSHLPVFSKLGSPPAEHRCQEPSAEYERAGLLPEQVHAGTLPSWRLSGVNGWDGWLGVVWWQVRSLFLPSRSECEQKITDKRAVSIPGQVPCIRVDTWPGGSNTVFLVSLPMFFFGDDDLGRR